MAATVTAPASKVIVAFTDGATDTTNGVTSVAVETSPARLVITYITGTPGVQKVKVWNWDQVRGYSVEPDA